MKTPEKIKLGLEYVSTTNIARKVMLAKAGKVPYAYMEEVASDALAYIRQLEARLVEANKTLDDLRAKLAEYEKPLVPLKVGYLLKENPVWLEYNSGSVEICELSTRYNAYCAYFIGDEDEEYLTRADYNKTWRCWPRKPTDEERKAAKWDD